MTPLYAPQKNRNVPFLPLNIATLTVSDSRTHETDTSGQTLIQRLTNAGHHHISHNIIPDNLQTIADAFRSLTAHNQNHVVISTGGTGLTGRDVTPEALNSVADKDVPGFALAFHLISAHTVGLAAIQSRAAAAVVNNSYVFCLPGSTGACRDAWDNILQYQLDNRCSPCNFADLIPRLGET